jgi:large conductance mechanosensitive channel
MSPAKLWQEFKGFAFKGNMIELAVAVVIGAAFGAVVKSMVDNIIMPLISYVIPGQSTYLQWHIGRLRIGAFLGDVLTFVTIAAAVFVLVVKVLGEITRRALPSDEKEPANKSCPLCLSIIPAKAVKCAHCTADLQPEGSPAPAR